ncbi:MAG: SBBP repeat-containing protein [Elusimicrobiota bacterium]
MYIKKSLYLLTLVLLLQSHFFTGTAHTSDGVFYGKITSTDSLVLSGAVVEVVDYDSKMFITTVTANTTGYYSVTLPTGTYELRVSSTNYEMKNTAGLISVSQSSTTQNFTLSLFSSNDLTVQWTTMFGGSADEIVTKPCIDGNNNVYITGITYGQIHATATLKGTNDYYYAKFSSFGVLSWIKQDGTLNEDIANDIVVDSSGNIYITGNNYIGVNDADGFIQKFDTNGTPVWTQMLNQAAMDNMNAIAIDSASNVYTASYNFGSYGGTTNQGVEDVVITKYTPGGSQTWIKQLGGTNRDVGGAIAVDYNNNVYVAGHTRSITFDGNTNKGNYDFLVIKYDSAGTKLWSKLFGTTANDYYGSVVTNQYGDLYVVYNIETYTDIFDIVLLKLCPTTGNTIWSHTIGTVYNDFSGDIVTTKTGDIYLSGNTTGGLFGNTNIGSNDLFLLKYDANGNYQWCKQFGTGVDDNYPHLYSDTDGNLYFSGNTNGNINNVVKPGGMKDGFIVKYANTLRTLITAVTVPISTNTATLAGRVVGKVVYRSSWMGDEDYPVSDTLVEFIYGTTVLYSTKTSVGGDYDIRLATGTYNIRFTADGFAMVTSTNIVVFSSATTIANVKLTLTGGILNCAISRGSNYPASTNTSSNFTYTLEIIKNDIIYESYTSTTGANTSLPISTGTYTLRANSYGFLASSTNIGISASINNVTLTLNPIKISSTTATYIVYPDYSSVYIPYTSGMDTQNISLYFDSVTDWNTLDNGITFGMKSADIMYRLVTHPSFSQFYDDITIKLAYTDDKILGLNENKLRIFWRQDLSNGTWQIIENSYVDLVNKKVVCNTKKTGYFCLYDISFVKDDTTKQITELRRFPSPFDPEREVMNISYVLATDARTRVLIVDLFGRQMYCVTFPSGSNGGMRGTNILKWDGRGTIGNYSNVLMDTGIYILCIESAEKVETRSIGIK